MVQGAESWLGVGQGSTRPSLLPRRLRRWLGSPFLFSKLPGAWRTGVEAADQFPAPSVPRPLTLTFPTPPLLRVRARVRARSHLSLPCRSRRLCRGGRERAGGCCPSASSVLFGTGVCVGEAVEMLGTLVAVMSRPL